MVMVSIWKSGFLERWVAHGFGSGKLKLVPTVCPPQLVHRVPALILNSNYVKNRLLYCGSFIVHMYVVITYSRVWINRVRLPILLVVS